MFCWENSTVFSYIYKYFLLFVRKLPLEEQQMTIHIHIFCDTFKVDFQENRNVVCFSLLCFCFIVSLFLCLFGCLVVVFVVGSIWKLEYILLHSYIYDLNIMLGIWNAIRTRWFSIIRSCENLWYLSKSFSLLCYYFML